MTVTVLIKVLYDVKQQGKVTFTAGHFAWCQALNETTVFNLCLTQYWTFMLWSTAFKIGYPLTLSHDCIVGSGAQLIEVARF